MLLITVCFNVCLMLFLVDAAYQPPKFSDASVQYEDKTDDYYDLKDYAYLTGEANLYRKSPPGGLLEGDAPKGGSKKQKGGKKGQPSAPVAPVPEQTPEPATQKRGGGSKKQKGAKKGQKSSPEASVPEQSPEPGSQATNRRGPKARKEVPPKQDRQMIIGPPKSRYTPKPLTDERMAEITRKVEEIRRNSGLNKPGYPTITVTRKRWVNGKWEDM
uniref:Collagen-like salivary secreted protein n=1 Tax=Simulium guianense TaxID=445764 RepID=F5GTM8_SIMGU